MAPPWPCEQQEEAQAGRACGRSADAPDRRMCLPGQVAVARPGASEAATVYGDEVVLPHPTATMLASVAAMGQLEPAELVGFMRTLAPSLGEPGASFEQAMAKIESDHDRGRGRSRGSVRSAATRSLARPASRCSIGIPCPTTDVSSSDDGRGRRRQVRASCPARTVPT